MKKLTDHLSKTWTGLDSRLKRFLIATSISFVVAAAWPVSLLLSSPECRDDAVRWIKHSLTFGLVHHTFFSIGLGVFFATIDWKGHLSSRKALYVLLALMTVAIWTDFSRPPMQPYTLRDSCGAYEQEVALRTARTSLKNLQAGSSLPSANAPQASMGTANNSYLSALADYETQYWRKSMSLGTLLTYGGVVAWISLGENLFFGLFMTTYFWFAITVLGPWNKKREKKMYGPLLTIWALVVIWVPCRMYADWYQNLSLNPDLTNPTLMFVAVIALGLLVCIGYFLVRDLFNPGLSSLLVSIAGLLITVVAFVARSTIFTYIARNLEEMPFIFFATLCIGMLLVVGVIALDVVTGSLATGRRAP